MTNSEQDRWSRVKGRLRSSVGEDVYTSWFARMDLEGVQDESVRLSVPTRFLKSWIQAHYAERVLSCVLDYIATRPEIDKNRVAMHGVSWGAYWATKMAIVERARLKGASAQSPPIDTFFQKEFLMNSLIGNREYLFDQVPALMAIFDNVKTVDQLAAIFPEMSLVKQGLLGKPMSPMLILAGVLDTQVPISDIYLLMNSGDVPKTAWVNPQGGHLGRQVGVWPDPRIFKEVIIPWLVKTLEPESAKAGN